jgi:hypothetical protein
VRGDTSSGKRLLLGACECGAVRYQVADEFLYAANCHCSRCRAATGSAFEAFAGIQRSKLEIEEGLGNLLVHRSDELNDTRFGTCGSLLFSVVRDAEYVHVAMGSLVDEPSVRRTEHIFVGSNARWFEITDDLRKRRSTSSRARAERDLHGHRHRHRHGWPDRDRIQDRQDPIVRQVFGGTARRHRGRSTG